MIVLDLSRPVSTSGYHTKEIYIYITLIKSYIYIYSFSTFFFVYLLELAHISDGDLILCRVHAIAGETKDCTDAVRYSVNSTETASFNCRGTTLDYSCNLE